MLISNTKKRKGMILLVVVAFLAMFTVMGLTYLLHADNQLKNSIDELLALDMKEDPHKVIDLKPSVVLDFFLEKFLYDQADTVPLQGNAIRGQSLARNIYGGYVSGGFNDKAFSGTGKLNKDFEVVPATVTPAAPAIIIKEWQMVNYSFNSAFNPERLSDGGSGIKTSTWNAPYTYPDHNNFYLGWLKSDGTKVIPSFHRDYIFGSMAAPFANANWTNIKGKYLTPRPRPADHNGFPYPDADGMDVKNLEGYPGGNDSIWIDVGSPVYTALDGRKYKIMVAPLILDLDGRINVNVAGNLMGTANTHASNQGWGPWEINLSTVLGGTANAITESQQINLGYSDHVGGTLLLPGVYGTSKIPGGSGTLPTVNLISSTYSMLDFNAKSETGANAPLAMSNSFASFPTFSGNYTANVATNEIGVGGSHPSFVNPYITKGGNSKFTNNEMASLIRWSGQGSAPKATNLVNLLKNTLGADYIYDNSTMAIRNRITTLSADIQQSTLLPYSFTSVGGPSPYLSNFGYGKYPESDLATNPKNLSYPLGTPLAFPIPLPNVGATNIAPGSKADFSFDLTSSKITGVSSIVGYMNQINLNRNLTNYPSINTTFTGGVGGGGRYADTIGYTTAVNDRQIFATEIFNGLKLATGVEVSDFEANRYLAQLAANMVDYIDVDDVMTTFKWKDGGGNPALDEYVFGVELPKVVINEVYSEIRNDPSDTFPEFPAGSKKHPADKSFNCNFWIELVNPLPADVSKANSALLEQDPYVDGVVTKRAPVYKIQILDQATGKDPALMKFDNVKGDPSLPDKIDFKGFKPDASMDDPVAANCKYDKAAFQTVVVPPETPFEAYEKKVCRILHPIDVKYNGGIQLDSTPDASPDATRDGQTGFITIGPAAEFPATDPANVMAPSQYNNKKFAYISNIRIPELKYDIPKADPDFAANVITDKIAAKKHTVVLRRLANPYMKPQDNKALVDYNPYVTVDFVEDVPVNDAVTNSNEDERGKNGTLAGPSTVATISDRKSYNKVQPYRSSTTMVPSALQVPLVGQPQHTFLRHNGSTVTAPVAPPVPVGAAATDTMLQMPFKWLMHLDRKLISPLELLNVSGCKPAEVTQRFANLSLTDPSKPYNNVRIDPATMALNPNFNVYKYVLGISNYSPLENYPPLENKAPWLDEASNLYRFLALADIQGYQQGTAFAGRQIGKININNIWDKEVFNALCDANGNNNFTQAEVNTVFTNFMTSRSPSNEPAPGDNPLWGFGVGKSTGGDNWTSSARGIDNSFLRLNTLPLAANAPNGVFDLPVNDTSTPPIKRNSFQQKELLSKIYNNVTTKSNVFGVWITTGYFKVEDDTTNPPTLGAEIGKIAGRNIRHRMFAIVDRTNMTSFETTYPNAITITPPATSVTVPYAGAITGINPNTRANWSIQAAVAPNLPATQGSPGTILVFEPNTDFEETVEVQVGGNVTFTKNHPAGCKVINRGNPGPWVGYDRTKDRDVVPYAEIIE